MLTQRGYDPTYYLVPGGFAVITRVEHFDPSGKALAPAERWSLDLRPKTTTIGGILRGVFVAPQGDYRAMLFIVTNESFKATGSTAKVTTLGALAAGGANSLPLEARSHAVEFGTQCSAFVYEFEGRGSGAVALAVIPGRVDAHSHLLFAGLTSLL